MLGVGIAAEVSGTVLVCVVCDSVGDGEAPMVYVVDEVILASQ